MNNPLISVLMVTYNRASIIKEAIDSVLNQTYKNLQFIIVDDGSTDNTCELIDSINDPRIELYSLKENRHICYATNYGMTKIKGEYLARIDSDDLWCADKLEKQLSFLENNEKYKICFSWIDVINEKGECINEEQKDFLELYEKQLFDQHDSLKFFFESGNCIAQPSVLMKMEVVEKVGDFNPGYRQLHDFDYWIRIAKHFPLYIIPERLISVRRFAEDSTMENNSKGSRLNAMQWYNEYMDIRKHYFDDMDDDLFIKTFKDDLINKNLHTSEEIECEKAFLLSKPLFASGIIPIGGLEKFFELLCNPSIKIVLEEKYGFIEKTFYEMTNKDIHYNYLIQSEIHSLHGRLHQLQVQNNELLIENNMYKNSLSWKITKPLRKVGRIVRKR